MITMNNLKAPPARRVNRKIPEFQIGETFFNLSSDLLCIVDRSVRFARVNPAWMRILGWAPEDLVSHPVADIVHPEDSKTINAMEAGLVESTSALSFENRCRCKDGSYRWLSWNSIPLGNKGYLFAVVHDINTRKKTELKLRMSDVALRESLRDKDILLKEVHHRVKNNFQIITSLISLQSGKIKNREAFKQFTELSNRIRAMSLIHEKLYRSNDLSRIDLGDYISTIVSELYSSYVNFERTIQFDIRTEPVDLGIEQSIPCGLVINEILTNAFKYAFPDGFAGPRIVTIILRNLKGKHVELQFSDNGVGLPADLVISRTDSLGLSLVPLLTAQMGGTLELDRTAGTTYTIRFVKK